MTRASRLCCSSIAVLLLVLLPATVVRAQYFGAPAADAADDQPVSTEIGDHVEPDDPSFDYTAETYATPAPNVVRVTGIDVIPNSELQAYADETPHPLDQPQPSAASVYATNDADDGDDSVEVDSAESTEQSAATTANLPDDETTNIDYSIAAATDAASSAAAADLPLPDYSVRPLNVSAAIFEHIAPVQFYTQRWRIQAHVQLPDFAESLDAIDRYDELVRQVCDGFVADLRAKQRKATAKPLGGQRLKKGNATTTSTTPMPTTLPPHVEGADLQAHCRNAEREVTMLTNRVRTTNEELRKVTATARGRSSKAARRTKRSTDSAGVTETERQQAAEPSFAEGARQLYLAVEEVVSDKLFDRVELLEREAQWGFRLMKNELNVLRGTNNAVYKTVWKLTDVQKENDANIKRMVRKLRSLRSAVASEANELQARMTLVELVQLISLELTGMVEQQNEVLSLVTTSAAGRLHPMVMGVADLTRVYTNVSQTMGLSDILVSGSEDMVPKMVSIESAQDGRNVEVRIEVPMVRRDEFQLYRAYALPKRAAPTRDRQMRAAASSAVVLEEPYLAVNEADGTYVQLSDEELRQCNTLGARLDDASLRFVCKLAGPMYTSGADSCLISLFQQRPLAETPCELQSARSGDRVQKMRMASTWLWLAANASTVRVSCAARPGVEAEVLVPAQAIVQLNGMCDLEAATFRLRAESTVFRNATVLQSKEMASAGGNIAAIDEFAMAQATATPVFASHDLDQDPIRLTQPRQYHRWLNENGRAIGALARSFRQVDAARKKGKQQIANQQTGETDYMQVILTVGQVALRIVRLIVGLVTRIMGDADDADFFF